MAWLDQQFKKAGGAVSNAWHTALPTKDARNIAGTILGLGAAGAALPLLGANGLGVTGSGGYLGQAAGGIKGALSGAASGIKGLAGGTSGLTQALGQNGTRALLGLGGGYLADKLNPTQQLPNVPSAQGSLAGNPELQGLYDLRKQAMMEALGSTPGGYSDLALSGIREAMAADRQARLDEARDYTQERAIDLGRGSSSMTDQALNDVNTSFAREANLSDAKLLMEQEAMMQRDREYSDNVKAQALRDMVSLMGTAQDFNDPQYRRDLAQVQMDNTRANNNQQGFMKLLGNYQAENQFSGKTLAEPNDFDNWWANNFEAGGYTL